METVASTATSPDPGGRTIPDQAALRLSARLLLLGQVLYIVVTQLHAGGDANNHPAIFAVYAGSWSWTAVHLGQFAAMAILLAGLLALSFALEAAAELVTWVSRFGAASAVAALALYGTLQAVDGVANKQADAAWLSAPSAEKTARFANAEAIRWVEWGLRSYQDYAVGLALLLFAAALVRTALPRPIAILMGLAGLTFLAQGWVVGVDGFSGTESITIVIGWALNLGWMTWLLVASSRMRYSGLPSPGR